MPSPDTTGIPKIDSFFNPRKIALVGASADYRKLGNSVLMNLLSSQVDVYPITTSTDHVLGVKAYRSLSEIPSQVDLVIVAVSAKLCAAIMPEIRAAGARSAVVISGGFSEIGEAGAELEKQLVEAAHAAGVRLIGPNCVGVSNTRLFNGTFTMMPESGSIALVSQSGALGGMLIYVTKAKRIGMSKFASLGNASDVSFDEILGYFAQDPETHVIAAYVEGVKEGRELFASLQNASTKKPVIVLKGGRSEAGNLAAKSHTGSLAGSSELFDGMLHQAGCVSAPTLDTLLEIAKMFDYQPIPKGRRVGIISNTGGAGVLAADALSDLNLHVSPLGRDTRNELKRSLSPLASVENPVDVVASGGRQDYKVATELMLRDSEIDTLLVICAVPTFAGMTQTEHASGTLEGVRTAGTDKPVVGVWLAGDVGRPGKDLLELNRIPCYDDPYTAALCISRTVQYTEAKARRNQT